MSDPISIQAPMYVACEAALAEYISSASQIPVFGDPAIPYESDWKVRGGSGGRSLHKILFPFSAFHGDLSHFARAYVSHYHRINAIKPHAGSQYMRAFSFLSEAMEEADCSSVIALTPKIFSRAQHLIEKAGFIDSTTMAHSQRLQKISVELVNLRICLIQFNWINPYSYSKTYDVFSQEMREAQKRLLPEKTALFALSDLRCAIESKAREGCSSAKVDLIIYWIVIIIFATGIRVSEALSLENNFIIRKVAEIDGVKSNQFFIRRTTSKGGPSDAKPLSPLAALLCRTAQKYLMTLTRGPRRTLTAFLENRDTAPEWSTDNTTHLDKSGLKRLLEIESPHSNPYIYSALNRDGLVFLQDIREHLNSSQEKYLTGFSQDGLDRRYFPIQLNWRKTGTPRLGPKIVRLIQYPDLRNFLSGNGGAIKSAFSRYLGVDHQLAAHQFRRLMDTSVREGGISENELALLQGRANPAQNAAYDYRTPDERARDVKSAVRGGEAFGWTSQTYWSLPIEERDAFLDSVVQVAYRTPVGHCLTNISEDPCPFHLQCLSGCGDYVHVKGDKAVISELELQRRWAVETLGQLTEYDRPGKNPRSVQNHQGHLRRQLKTIDKVLAIEQNSHVKIGTSVRVNPNNESFAEDPDQW